MYVKEKGRALRTGIQHGIYSVINPFVKLLIKLGITPNMVTTIGAMGSLAGAILMIIAGYKAGHSADGVIPYNLIIWAGGIIIGFSVFDMLDGQVARLGNMVTRFGAMYDSILDRYCELFTLGGITYYFTQIGELASAIITYVAIIGSLMVSYVRARAEGVGIECKMGFMQRPERVVVTFIGILLCGILGACGISWANIFLTGCMLIIAIFANLTAAARINHCRKNLQ